MFLVHSFCPLLTWIYPNEVWVGYYQGYFKEVMHVTYTSGSHGLIYERAITYDLIHYRRIYTVKSK